MIPKCGRAIACTKFARHVVTTVRRVRFTMLFTIFLQIHCSLFSSFITIYTGEWGSRLTFILALLFFCLFLLFLGTSASNGNCLYLGAAVAVNAVPSFCFGECDRELPLFGVTE